MTFTQAFEPGRNKETGLSIATFRGLEVKNDPTLVKDKITQKPLLDDNGNPVTKPWERVNLVFEVRGAKSGMSQEISVTTNGKLGNAGDLQQMLCLLGWVVKSKTMVIDEDGIEIEEGGDDEDLNKEVNEFVESIKGKKFWLKVTRNKNYWNIDPGTIKPKE